MIMMLDKIVIDFDDIGLQEIFMFMMILLGAAAVFWLLAGYVNQQKEDEIASHPIQKEYAKIIDCQMATGNTYGMAQSNMWVLFELKNGNRMRFSVEAKNGYTAGDAGMLTWQGSRLLSFRRGEEGAINGASRTSGGWECGRCHAINPRWTSSCLKCAEHRTVESKVTAVGVGESVKVDRSGASLTCPKCGTSQRPDKKYCFHCGVRFE